ncbi:MAG TPA: LOG family protein [Anaerolineales bacterium]|nr:LOG family protein [Anaerolineales bacterium]
MAERVISVFGGSAARPGDSDWRGAESLGRRMAQAGWAVATGGYGGIMEAVSLGAAQAGGHVIGVTCDEIEVWRTVSPNGWIQEQVRVPRLRDRLIRLIEMGRALVAFPGGVGTLSEVALSWSMLQTQTLTRRPLVLVGEVWSRMMSAFLDSAGGYVAPSDREMLSFQPDGEQAAEFILRHLSPS